MTLFRKAPETLAEDEAVIWSRYWDIPWGFLREGVPLAAIAYFLDVKWVVAYGFFTVAFSIGALDARLHDIIIRIRRLSETERSQDSN
jgi:hypothetical protein